MTIKELESRTGMTRANIRFYEAEGLLLPKRLDNGYRDYAEEDARTLEKIKLLRQLQLDIDTIRKVQQGTLTLEQALFVQHTRLEGDRAVIERAAQVCRELEHSGVEYAALEPRPWLQQLEAPQESGREALPAAPPPARDWESEPRACYCPWRRFFARSLDMSLYDAILNVAWLLAFRDGSFLRLQMANLFTTAFSSMALLALTLALEPLWLHFWGWTPGKWLFGLKLRDEDGAKLSIAQARGRCRELAWQGYGWNIPFWSLWRMWQGRVAGLEGRDCPWDSEEGYRYIKEERRFSVPVFVAAQAVLAGMRWCWPRCGASCPPVGVNSRWRSLPGTITTSTASWGLKAPGWRGMAAGRGPWTGKGRAARLRWRWTACGSSLRSRCGASRSSPWRTAG